MVRTIVANLWSRLSVHWTTRCRVQLCELISSTSVMWWYRCPSISKRELQLKSKINFILSRLLRKTPEETLKIKLFSRSWSRQDWTQERKCLKNTKIISPLKDRKTLKFKNQILCFPFEFEKFQTNEGSC